MINVTLIVTSGAVKTCLVPEDQTVREFLDSQNVNYQVSTIFSDGYTFKPGDIDKTFEELGVQEKVRLTVCVKTPNAATVVVAGNSCVVTSSMKLDDLKLIQKMRPRAMTLIDEDEEPLFAISTTDKSAGRMNKFGATFGSRTNAEGKATLTILLEGEESPAEWVQEHIGVGLLYLNELEESFAEIIEEIHAEQEKIKSQITIL